MKNNLPLEHIFTPQEHSFEGWTEFGTMTVTLTLGELGPYTSRVWGDWGPMVQATPINPYCVTFSYLFEHATEVGSSTLQIKKLTLNSPVQAETRAQHPLYWIVDDERRDLRMHIYVTSSGEFSHIEGFRLSTGQHRFEATKVDHKSSHSRVAPNATPSVTHA